MNTAETELVAALRSGKYQQAKGVLRSSTAFCCLGVACHLYDSKYWEEDFDGDYSYLGLTGYLPNPVRDDLQWKHYEGSLRFFDREEFPVFLSTLNDTGFTFNQIADLISADLVVKSDEDIDCEVYR